MSFGYDNCNDCAGGLAYSENVLGVSAQPIAESNIYRYNYYCYVFWNKKIYDCVRGGMRCSSEDPVVYRKKAGNINGTKVEQFNSTLKRLE